MTDLELSIKAARFLSVDAVEKANSGHPGTAMALATVGVEIFARHLRHNPKDPSWPNRDRFVLSCGHVSALLYSLLHLSGYAVSLDDLKNFRQWASRTPGHPELGMTDGVETTTGPLGQGLANAVGLALASKMMAARFNTPERSLIDYRVYAIVSDGDIMEGITREAISLAGHWGLDNLVVVYDDNRITIDGTTELSLSDNVDQLFSSSGWFTQNVDGHSATQVRDALERARANRGTPSLVIARTHIGVGAPHKQDTSGAHGTPLGSAEISATKQIAGWPTEPSFYVPVEAYKPFIEHASSVRQEYESWRSVLSSLDAVDRKRFEQFSRRVVPEGLFASLLSAVGSNSGATRKLASIVEQKAAEVVPSLIGGSADLNSSIMTKITSSTDVRKGEFSGRNINFGVREHAMSAILNGLSLSGFFIPLGSTFLIFSDYMRPALRLSALMHRQVVFAFSHDSIYVGEDGPTHQPIEQISSLRMIPNVHVVRPADGLECAAAWTHALSRTDGPTVLVLSRQALPELERPAGFDPDSLLQGAYVLLDVANPELVLIATGSEVSIAAEAQKILARENRRVRVVSAPCWEQFETMQESVRQAILPPGVRRAAIEIGSSKFWKGVVGLDGLVIGIDRFGASAPWERLQTEFGFSAEQVAITIRKRFWSSH
jgi:transketolase